MRPVSPADRQIVLDCLAGISTAQKKVAALDLALTLITDIAGGALSGDEPSPRDEDTLRTVHRAIAKYDFALIGQHLERLTAVLERVFAE